MEKDTGGTAFPLPLGSETVEGQEGMTLRDYFAAKLMPAVIGSLNGPVTGEEYPGDFDHYAECSYRMADAMLRARGQ
ncbi:hypothetical protein [Pantoea agglomerans]|jgi:hypothetical protein|uniref:hypothetical protein n=1 Tax=Enterobacter agglomerans TaxID=549 RepID=UPI00177A9F28|nr:hypothetical protein [Pantoea agglomerans]MBD8132025.1 hypothetical protein [Pantoea agglomerans]SMQ21144.1 hypothetical protein SAMN02744765_0461 [Pantoea agglomerans]